ncbi:MAG: ROK family protein, partial [Verrucomicrobiota bacterium]
IRVGNGFTAETLASGSARERADDSLEEWARKFDRVLNYLEDLLSPDLFIVGGGEVKKMAKWSQWLTVRTPVERAAFKNRAGILGAAMSLELQH